MRMIERRRARALNERLAVPCLHRNKITLSFVMARFSLSLAEARAPARTSQSECCDVARERSDMDSTSSIIRSLADNSCIWKLLLVSTIYSDDCSIAPRPVTPLACDAGGWYLRFLSSYSGSSSNLPPTFMNLFMLRSSSSFKMSARSMPLRMKIFLSSKSCLIFSRNLDLLSSLIC